MLRQNKQNTRLAAVSPLHRALASVPPSSAVLQHPPPHNDSPRQLRIPHKHTSPPMTRSAPHPHGRGGSEDCKLLLQRAGASMRVMERWISKRRHEQGAHVTSLTMEQIKSGEVEAEAIDSFFHDAR